MKKLLVLCSLLSIAFSGFGQKGFGLDGTLGLGINGSEMINPLLLEGRVQLDDHFSTNLGLGLWNSGYKAVWNSETGTDATIYKLTDNKALPTIQVGLAYQFPVGKLMDRDIDFFVEPKLMYLPFSARTTYLNELYYTISYDGTEKVYTAGPSEDNQKTSLKSDCHGRLYYLFQAGFRINLHENFDLSLGYGYTNIDLFKDLRGRSIKGFGLNDYLPKPGMQLINITLQYNYNLN